MVKELDQVHKRNKSWAENSDPSRSVSQGHALAALPGCLPPLGICTSMLWAFVGPLLPPNLRTPVLRRSPPETGVTLQQGN